MTQLKEHRPLHFQKCFLNRKVYSKLPGPKMNTLNLLSLVPPLFTIQSAVRGRPLSLRGGGGMEVCFFGFQQTHVFLENVRIFTACRLLIKRSVFVFVWSHRDTCAHLVVGGGQQVGKTHLALKPKISCLIWCGPVWK